MEAVGSLGADTGGSATGGDGGEGGVQVEVMGSGWVGGQLGMSGGLTDGISKGPGVGVVEAGMVMSGSEVSGEGGVVAGVDDVSEVKGG